MAARGRRIVLMIGLVLAPLAGCEGTARLYPANDIATHTGVLQARFMRYGTGHGELEITMPDGELLKGEYSVISGGSVGFGTIFSRVYGPHGSATVTSTGTSFVTPGGSPGMASAFGPNGTSIQCEFYLNNMSGHGAGACQSSAGALYQLQF